LLINDAAIKLPAKTVRDKKRKGNWTYFSMLNIFQKMPEG